ncbi:MAG: DUF4136 domain-containing protein [Epsilonproteobacteria bacterium]|nr:DUF4136 domain-containing protein [Campylobacterota bacterium]
MRYILTFFMALFLTACSTLQTEVDYDEGYDFSKIKTFAVVHKVKEGESTLVADRISEAIKQTLKQKGLKEVSRDKADVVMLFHLNVQNKTEIYTDYQMVGYGRYGGMVISTPRSYNYDEGKLIIDAYDPKINKTIYRVVLVDEIKHKKTPQERKEYVMEVVSKGLKDFLATK